MTYCQNKRLDTVEIKKIANTERVASHKNYLGSTIDRVVPDKRNYESYKVV